MCLAKEKRLPANIINANRLYQNDWELFHDSIAELEPNVLIQPKPYNHTEKKKKKRNIKLLWSVLLKSIALFEDFYLFWFFFYSMCHNTYLK